MTSKGIVDSWRHSNDEHTGHGRGVAILVLWNSFVWGLNTWSSHCRWGSAMEKDYEEGEPMYKVLIVTSYYEIDQHSFYTGQIPALSLRNAGNVISMATSIVSYDCKSLAEEAVQAVSRINTDKRIDAYRLYKED
jgi:hypothetical protein